MKGGRAGLRVKKGGEREGGCGEGGAERRSDVGMKIGKAVRREGGREPERSRVTS